MKTIYFLAFLLLSLLTNELMAQTVRVDSLERALQTTNDKQTRLELLNDLAFEVLEDDPDRATRYTNEALALGTALDTLAGIGDAYVCKGLIGEVLNNYEDALVAYEEALAIRTTLKDSSGVASVYNNIGNLYEIQGKYDLAKTAFQKGLAILDLHNNQKRKAILLSNLGSTYKYLNDYKAALAAYTEALTIRKALGNQKGIGLAYKGMGSLEASVKNFSQAIEYYEQSLAIFAALGATRYIVNLHNNIGNVYYEQGNYTEALRYYKLVADSELLTQVNQAKVYNNMGLVLEKTGTLAQALVYYERALELMNTADNAKELIRLHNNIGLYYYVQQTPDKALPFFKKAYELQDSVPDRVLNLEVLNNLSNTLARLKRFDQALALNQQADQLENEITTAEKDLLYYKIEQIEDRERIALLHKDKEIQTQKSIRLQQLLIALLLIIILLAFLWQKNRKVAQQKAQQLETEKAVQSQQKKIDDLLSEVEWKSNYARLEGQDKERKRIGQDLHDDLGGTLSTVKLCLSALEGKLDETQDGIVAQYEKTNDLLDVACQQVREIAHNLDSSLLAKFGLDLALRDLAETIEQAGTLEVNISTAGLDPDTSLSVNPAIDPMIELNIYRIIQELVSNVLRHAQATELTIRVNRYNGELNILVEDNGIGFNEQGIQQKGGMGLKNIAARVQQLKGILNIDSGKGGGTTISIDLNVNKNKDEKD